MQNQHELVSSWFERHEAKIQQCQLEGETLLVLDWREPGTNVYSIRYILDKSTLYVSGDLGDAVYCWYRPIALDFFATIGIDYFESKCNASEAGRDYFTWDEAKAFVATVDILKDLFDVDFTSEEDLDSWLDQREAPFDVEDIKGACCSEEGWYDFLQNNDEIFGHDVFEYEGGRTIHIRCLAHLIGLKKALADLKNKGLR